MTGGIPELICRSPSSGVDLNQDFSRLRFRYTQAITPAKHATQAARRLGLCQQAAPRAEAILGTGDPAQISSTGCATTRNPEMHRLAHVPSHLFDAAEERGYGI